jgi:hypothetical protein
MVDLLLFLVMFVGIIATGLLLAVGGVLLASSHERERAKQAWVEMDTLRASRRLHDIASVAFQAMLDEARSARSNEQAP